MGKIREYLKDPWTHAPKEIEFYLHGACESFAIATHRLTGWEIVGIIEPRVVAINKDFIQAYGLVHAFCTHESKQGQVFDAKGWRNANDLNKEYPLNPGCIVRFFSQEKLNELVNPNSLINEDNITKATHFIRRHYIPFLGVVNKTINKCNLE